MVDQAHHTFHFNTPMIPVTVVFDAGSHLLKTLEMQKSPSEWLWQMQHGSSMLDRYDALVALRGNTAIQDYKTELEQAWNREYFREMRAEIASQWLGLAVALGLDANDVMLKQFVSSPHASVRKVLFEKLPLQPAFRDLFLQGLKDSSYANVESVVNRLWSMPTNGLNSQGPESGFISHREILEAIKEENGHLHNLKVKYLELAYSEALTQQQKQGNLQGGRTENEPQLFLNPLISMAGPYYEFRTRTNAMAALKRLNVLTPELCQNLFDAILGFNSRLASPAIDLIQYFKQQSNYKALIIKEIQKTSSLNPLGKPYTEEEQKRLMNLVQ